MENKSGEQTSTNFRPTSGYVLEKYTSRSRGSVFHRLVHCRQPEDQACEQDDGREVLDSAAPLASITVGKVSCQVVTDTRRRFDENTVGHALESTHEEGRKRPREREVHRDDYGIPGRAARMEMIARECVVGPGLMPCHRPVGSGVLDQSRRRASLEEVSPRATERSGIDSVRGAIAQRRTNGGRWSAPGTQPEESWCPAGLSHGQKRRVQRLRTQEKFAKRAEDERDRWFNRHQPMTGVKKTWREKRLAREGGSDSGDSGSPARGDEER